MKEFDIQVTKAQRQMVALTPSSCWWKWIRRMMSIAGHWAKGQWICTLRASDSERQLCPLKRSSSGDGADTQMGGAGPEGRRERNGRDPPANTGRELQEKSDSKSLKSFLDLFKERAKGDKMANQLTHQIEARIANCSSERTLAWAEGGEGDDEELMKIERDVWKLKEKVRTSDDEDEMQEKRRMLILRRNN